MFIENNFTWRHFHFVNNRKNPYQMAGEDNHNNEYEDGSRVVTKRSKKTPSIQHVTFSISILYVNREACFERTVTRWRTMLDGRSSYI